jgi:multicomponent Na+:H+ antiporter subunit E
MTLLRSTFLLTAVYIALTANLQPSNILTGILLSLVILTLMRPAGVRTKINWRFSPGGFLPFIRYILILISDLMISGIEVARIVLDPDLPIRQGAITIPTNCESEVAQALSAHAITVTPGEMVVEIGKDGTMYTHVLDTAMAEEGIKQAQEMREELLEKIAL